MSKATSHFRISLTKRAEEYLSALAVVAVFGVSGLLFLWGSHAATPVVAVQPEQATVTAPAITVSDSTAAGSSAVKFAPTNSGTSTAKPDATNTGVPASTSLTVVNGNQTYSTNNQVISGMDIHGAVFITGKNVTLKNSIVRGDSSIAADCTTAKQHNSSVIFVEDPGSATISHVEVAPGVSTSCLDGIWAVNTTLDADNIHGSVDGVKAFDNVTIQNSYIHDLVYYATQPGGGGQTDNDAIQTYEANAHINITHNNLDVSTDDNSDYQLTQDSGQQALDIHIDSNWLYGGGCTLNISSNGAAAITPANNITITNNRFGPSYYNCPLLIGTTVALTQQTGNVMDATGQPIAVQQHD